MAEGTFAIGTFQIKGENSTTIKASTIGEALGGFPAAAGPYATYRGFLHGPVPAVEGQNAPKGVYLLYLDHEFTSWLTIKVEDLLAHIEGPINPFDARGRVWVSHNARVTKSHSDEAHCIAEDLGLETDPAAGPTRPKGPPY